MKGAGHLGSLGKAGQRRRGCRAPLLGEKTLVVLPHYSQIFMKSEIFKSLFAYLYCLSLSPGTFYTYLVSGWININISTFHICVHEYDSLHYYTFCYKKSSYLAEKVSCSFCPDPLSRLSSKLFVYYWSFAGAYTFQSQFVRIVLGF